MKLSYSILFSIAVAVVTADDSYLRVPLQRKTGVSAVSSFKSTGNENISDISGEYVGTIEIGTPGQSIEVLVDTGSSDLWVGSDKNSPSDSFNPAQSSSYHHLNDDFDIQYGSGAAQGAWVTDDVSWGGLKVTQQQFGLVDNDTAANIAVGGLIGIGYDANEAANEDGVPQYDNFPASLAKQGVTKKNAYSLYLDSKESGQGEIVFGGVDTKKYTGQLYTVPIDSDNQLTTTVEVDGQSLPTTLLDSGTSGIYLPEDIYTSFGRNTSAKYDSDNDIYYFDEQPTEGPDLEVSFHGAKITVPFSELVIPSAEFFIPSFHYNHPYVLALSSGDVGNLIFGVPLLRSAYVVFDLDGRTISIAQAAWGVSDSNIVEISGSIPGAQPAPNL